MLNKKNIFSFLAGKFSLRYQRAPDADVVLCVPSDYISLLVLVVLRQHWPSGPDSPALHTITLSRLHHQYLDTAAILVLQDGEGDLQVD